MRLWSLADWDLRSDRNPKRLRDLSGVSLADWDLRSDRNHTSTCPTATISLADWDLRSDRNIQRILHGVPQSLADWDLPKVPESISFQIQKQFHSGTFSILFKTLHLYYYAYADR